MLFRSCRFSTGTVFWMSDVISAHPSLIICSIKLAGCWWATSVNQFRFRSEIRSL
jgi:hypothetical protein